MPTIHACGFHHINLQVADYPKSIAFYTELFDMKILREWGRDEFRFAMLDMGDGAILELATKADAKEADGAWRHLAIRVDSADTAFRAAVDYGALPISEPKDLVLTPDSAPLNIRIAFISGPDGEQIELFELR